MQTNYIHQPVYFVCLPETLPEISVSDTIFGSDSYATPQQRLEPRGAMPVRIVKKDDLRTEQHVRHFYWNVVHGCSWGCLRKFGKP